MNKTGSSSSRHRFYRTQSLSFFVGLVVAFTIIVVSGLVLVPVGVRALPGRYAARLPDFLQEFRHRPHPDILPTPAVLITPYRLPIATATAPPSSGVAFATDVPTREPTRERNSQLTPTATFTDAPALTPTEKPTETALPTHTPTNRATSTPTYTPAPTLTPTSTRLPTLPVRASLPPITHTYQTWNNCGPATVSMALRYYHLSGTQADAAAFLKPDPEDKNVSPDEMLAYARSLGLEATVRVGGDLDRLKRLTASGFPVIVETWFIPKPGDQMGHYRLLTGYDDVAREFTTQDSYNGPNVRVGYDAFDELWRVFNRVYLVVYHPLQNAEVAAILAEDVDDTTMYLRALEVAHSEALNPVAECVAYESCADRTAFAWFNVGSSLSQLGRHEEAAAAYDQARLHGLPWRMLWYQFGPYETYYAVERFEDVITLATVALNITYNLEESFFWRGMAHQAQGKMDQARSDYQAALKYNPNYAAAQTALESLD